MSRRGPKINKDKNPMAREEFIARQRANRPKQRYVVTGVPGAQRLIEEQFGVPDELAGGYWEKVPANG